ncbi:MAG: carbon-nitrogen hydrolase family protein [Candidatus Jordarchaeum sp.]|uniref:carbon-nitrogen hydrolase family protein n=1 Tax=Candidatus Jordarchaeum sp. TaxID=2823881 RepID=UPI004049E675
MKVRVAAIQILKEETKQKNIEKAYKLAKEAAKNEAEFICFPEKWNIKNGDPTKDSEDENGPSIRCLERIATENGVYVLGGSIWENQDKKYYNTSRLFDRNGNCIGIHKKIHLYKFEKMIFTAGTTLEPCKTEFGKVGMTVCFDLAFPEVSRILTLKGADIIFNPAFIPEPGIENWHIYLKARALENRIPIVAVNAVSNERSQIWPGYSLIIDFKEGYESPSKLELTTASSREEIIIANLNLDHTRKIREIRLSERSEIDKKIFENLKFNK